MREVPKIGGFAPPPCRADEERPRYPRATVEPLADVRQCAWNPRHFTTAGDRLFPFVPDVVGLELGSNVCPPPRFPRTAAVR